MINVDVHISMEAQVYDRCDVLGMASSYLREKRPNHASIEALGKLHDVIKSDISKQTTGKDVNFNCTHDHLSLISSWYVDIKKTVPNLRRNIANVLEDNKFKMKPYGLQSVVYREKGDDHERYWSHIWVCKEKDNGQWYRFSEGNVSKVTEDKVLAEERLPFAVIYMDCSVPRLSQSEAEESIPSSLKVMGRIIVLHIREWYANVKHMILGFHSHGQ